MTASAPAHPPDRPGRFALRVSITDKDGAPIPNLGVADFRLDDNGKPSRIFTVQPPTQAASSFQVVLILDNVNPGDHNVNKMAQEFLRRNRGHLPCPFTVYSLRPGRMFAVGAASRDGNDLAEKIAHPLMNPVRGLNSSSGPMPFREGLASLPDHGPMALDISTAEVLSLQALGAVTLGLRNVPGRKLVVWFGTGWNPAMIEADDLLNRMTEYSTRMREAGMVLDWVNDEEPKWEKGFALGEYVQPAVSSKDAFPERLALPVLAMQSGGAVLLGNKWQQNLEQAVTLGAASYTLTYDPVDTDKVDEYHALTVTVDRPGAAVRAGAGYYDEPSYFDHPDEGFERMSVAELDKLVRTESGRRGTNLAEQFARAELTERLSTPHLEELLTLLKNPNDRRALIEVADASAFLRLPTAEIPPDPPPPIAEQRAIAERAFAYLKDAIPRLPDFFAERQTVLYERKPVKANDSWKAFTGDPGLYTAAVSKATVLYRDGKEVVSDEREKNGHGYSRRRSLQTSGIFGVALTTILYGVAGQGSILVWDHWEHGPQALEAVFRFQVSEAASRFSTSFCCTIEDQGKGVFQRRGAYDGELAIDPKSGAILRIVEEGEFDLQKEPDLPVSRSEIGIEYAPVNIGGKIYISPVRSFSTSRGRTVQAIPQWGTILYVYGPFQTAVEDITFMNYHKFGSTSRILSGFVPAPESEKSSKPK